MLSALISIFYLSIGFCSLELQKHIVRLSHENAIMRRLKEIDRFLTSLIHSNVTRIGFVYLPILFFFIARKNIVRFSHENVRIHPVLKRMDRLLTLLIHDNATRMDFFNLHAYVTIL